MKKAVIHILPALAAMALVWAVPAAAAWQADQPAGQEQQKGKESASPFALPEKAKSEDKPKAPAQGQSPFALPEKGQAASVPAGKSQSPFALPEKKPETKAAPADPEKIMDQGLAAAQAGQLDQAARAFAAAAEANPKDPRAWNNLGLTLRKQGKLNQAAQAYRRALQADPSFAVAHKNLGVLLEQAGERAKAAEEYLKYVQLNHQAADAAQVKKRAQWLKKKEGGK